MSVITLVDLDKLAAELNGRHYPNLRALTRNQYNRVEYDFAPFSGDEQEPSLAAGVWSDESLSPVALDVLEEEFEQARVRWRDARYVRDLTAATANASSVWSACADARATMDALFAALDTTEAGMWRATVSKLLHAQAASRAAASAWDETAKRIADVHHANLQADLHPEQAYRLCGVDATGWVVGFAEDYSGWGRSPLVQCTDNAIVEQRDHMTLIVTFSGDDPELAAL